MKLMNTYSLQRPVNGFCMFRINMGKVQLQHTTEVEPTVSECYYINTYGGD